MPIFKEPITFDKGAGTGKITEKSLDLRDSLKNFLEQIDPVYEFVKDFLEKQQFSHGDDVSDAFIESPMYKKVETSRALLRELLDQEQSEIFFVDPSIISKDLADEINDYREKMIEAFHDFDKAIKMANTYKSLKKYLQQE